MKKLRLAIVGCGDIAGYTAWISRLVPKVRLAACCDTMLERAQAFARRHRILQIYTDYEELLKDTTFDAVYLAVPHHLHYEMILAAVGTGRHVFVEKPVTRTIEEGRNLVMSHGNKKIGVNYQYRYDSGCYALARAVQSGALGKIHSVQINLPWHRDQEYFEGAPWHKTFAQAGGGTLITQGSHFLDIALWALQDPPISAMGYTATPGFNVEVETLASGTIETRGGILIGLMTTMAAVPEQAVTIAFYGERGTARYRNLPWPSVKFISVKPHRQRPPEWGVHALQRSLSGFANWVLEDKPYLTPAVESLPVLAAVDGLYRSAHSGKREMIEE